MLSLIHKPIIATEKPYLSASGDEYINYLRENKDSLFEGSTGIYLARKIYYDGQELFFPFIDIDGDKALHDDDKIESAIINTDLTLRILKKLNIDAAIFK